LHHQNDWHLTAEKRAAIDEANHEIYSSSFTKIEAHIRWIEVGRRLHHVEDFHEPLSLGIAEDALRDLVAEGALEVCPALRLRDRRADRCQGLRGLDDRLRYLVGLTCRKRNH
tara:strand:- start:786 stop:1124 length:339 start_codon:yes stop_codon:yes gene_type:complete